MIFRSPGSPGARLSWLATLLGAGHLSFAAATGTLRGEHVAADVLLVVLAWTGARTLRFLRGVIPLWLTGVMLDNQRLWLPLRGDIHVGGPWSLDASLFPSHVNGAVSNWAHYFSVNHTRSLDVLCGLGYATYLLEFFAVLALLFWRKHPRFERMAWTFFAANAIGCLVYLLIPVAPPWYVLDYGTGPANLAAVASPAGTARFDELFGIRFFHGFYARNPNVFGAMPSLHSAYPVIALWQLWGLGNRWRTAAGAFAILIGFSAVYLTHHYVLDVLCGVATAVVACAAVDFSLARGDTLA